MLTVSRGAYVVDWRRHRGPDGGSKGRASVPHVTENNYRAMADRDRNAGLQSRQKAS